MRMPRTYRGTGDVMRLLSTRRGAEVIPVVLARIGCKFGSKIMIAFEIMIPKMYSL